MAQDEIEKKKSMPIAKILKGWFINKTAVWKSEYNRKDKASFPVPQTTQHEISN